LLRWICDTPQENNMPTVLRIGPYRFFFYSADGDEPPHIHVERDDKIAKFWLDPVRFQNSGGFKRKEISLIQNIVREHEGEILEKWHEYFNG
jgi:hypothetical protein